MTSTSEQVILTGYEAARTGAAYYPVPGAGYLRIAGDDRLDFIQRQTTNDVKTLAPHAAQLTALTTGTARLMDVWRLLQEADGVIGVITLPGRGGDAARYLQSRIFFMDKVTVTDASAEFAQFEVFGPAARAVFESLGVTAPDPHGVVVLGPDDQAGRVIGLAGLIGRGWLVMVPAADADAFTARLAEAGAAPVNAATYDVLRVEVGLPGPARELTNDYTPLETNLDGMVSGTKGCYAGQEIIARQITYDKITKRLVGVRLAEWIAPGASVQVDGHSAGTITSAVVSPRLGSIALAVIKRPYFEPGTTLAVVAADGQRVAGETVALPFVE